MEEKFDDREDNEYQHKYSETDSRKLIEREYLNEEIRLHGAHVMTKALGDLSPVCEECGEICDEQSIKLRDAFFSRAKVLVDRLVVGLDLYKRERDFGVIEPIETINNIYKFWAELVCLHSIVEPQFRDEEDDEENE